MSGPQTRKPLRRPGIVAHQKLSWSMMKQRADGGHNCRERRDNEEDAMMPTGPCLHALSGKHLVSGVTRLFALSLTRNMGGRQCNMPARRFRIVRSERRSSASQSSFIPCPTISSLDSNGVRRREECRLYTLCVTAYCRAIRPRKQWMRG